MLRSRTHRSRPSVRNGRFYPSTKWPVLTRPPRRCQARTLAGRTTTKPIFTPAMPIAVRARTADRTSAWWVLRGCAGKQPTAAAAPCSRAPGCSVGWRAQSVAGRAEDPSDHSPAHPGQGSTPGVLGTGVTGFWHPSCSPAWFWRAPTTATSRLRSGGRHCHRRGSGGAECERRRMGGAVRLRRSQVGRGALRSAPRVPTCRCTDCDHEPLASGGSAYAGVDGRPVTRAD